MSDIHSYNASTRGEVGSSAAKALRAQHKVPVTVSRPGKDSLHVAVDVKTANHLAQHVVHLAKLTIGKDTLTVLKGAISKHPLQDNILHVDLLQVDEQSDIKVDVAVHPDARNCPGVKAGGIVEQRLRKVKVLCKANAIPDAIGLNLDDVQIMQTVYASKLVMPPGVKLLTNPKLPVLSIVISRGMAKDDTATADGATPAAGAAAPVAGDAKAAVPAAGGKAAAPAAGKAAPAAPAGKDAKKK